MKARELEGGATREKPRHSLFRCLEDKEERAGRADPCVCVCVSSCINNRNGALPEGPLPFQSLIREKDTTHYTEYMINVYIQGTYRVGTIGVGGVGYIDPLPRYRETVAPSSTAG